jgi:2-polyprenyl-3-methyl-5-hydroxy-6-metoxy-1,4-benzoquinol methylase
MDQNLYNEKLSKGYFSNPRPEIFALLPEKFNSLLDIGCGGGDFGALVKKEKNAEVWGVDLSSRAIALAERKIDHAILGEFSPNMLLPDHYFDVITFNDSLEHFADPKPALELCKKKLARGGRIVCSLPNVRYLENVIHFLIDMDWEYRDSGILDYTHLRFFTKKSMARLFEDAGYKVESINGINPHYWSGKKIFLLRLFFHKYVEDMKYLQYVVVVTL